MNRTLVILSLISSLAGHLAAQPIQLSGPIEGFTFDLPSGAFREVRGFPGSATFGEALPENFERGSAAPGRDFGVALRDGRYMVVTGLRSANLSIVELPGVHADPEGIVWSGDGSRAVFYSRSGTWIQTVAGLPDAGVAGAPVDLSMLSGSLSAIAADTSGKRIAIGLAGDEGGVYLIADDGAPVLLFSGSKPAALTFSDDGRLLYSVDGASLQVTSFQLADYTSQSFSLDRIQDPVAIKIKRDSENRYLLLIAGGNDRLVRIYNPTSYEILGDFPLDSPPTQLEDFGRTSLLLGPRAGSGDALWLFTTAPRLDVFFVPAPPLTSGGSE